MATSKSKPKSAKTPGKAKRPAKSSVPARSKAAVTSNTAVSKAVSSKAPASSPSKQHSVRGFFAGVVRKKLNLNLISDKVDGERTYRIAKPSAAR